MGSLKTFYEASFVRKKKKIFFLNAGKEMKVQMTPKETPKGLVRKETKFPFDHLLIGVCTLMM